ncbi:EAL domain-containing protein [Acidicapsa ligni]|uniref:EAL domain-containing protein n=1 Tax=Acidicapsa ligni TaxID=542300 RepID=UPI0021E08807|nr:EAL domain-containing protein [Acidicapsa ligni]
MVTARSLARFNRTWLFIAVVALGTLAGFLVGRQSILRTVEAHLANYGEQLEQHAEEVASEISSTLTSANHSPYPPCSNDEITFFRKLTFAAQFLKDVGRIHENSFVCSATTGNLATPHPLLKPSIHGPRNSVIFNNYPLIVPSGGRGEIITYGQANVVVSPDTFAEFSQGPIHYSIGLIDRSTHAFIPTRGEHFSFPPELLSTRKVLSVDGTLYLARCTNRYQICAVTYIREADVWQNNRILLVIYIVTGLIAGTSCGVVILFAGRRRRSHTSQLKRAILKGNLSVVYQPIVELHTHRIVGAEALARWTDEDGDSVRPEIIIALAEEEGFVSEITRFVVNRALQELRPLLESNPAFRLHINLAPSDLADPRLLILLDEMLQDTSISPSNITFELTERATSDREVAVASIRRLRERGHAIFIDDFGTGYSNLAYLSELNVDGIKVNRSFIATIGTDSVTASIVPQILALAKALNLSVVVQGIEREGQVTYFAGGDPHILGQGWFLGLPVPARSLRYLCTERSE